MSSSPQPTPPRHLLWLSALSALGVITLGLWLWSRQATPLDDPLHHAEQAQEAQEHQEAQAEPSAQLERAQERADQAGQTRAERQAALRARLREAASAPEVLPETSLEKTARAPHNATLTQRTPSPHSASWRRGDALPIRSTAVPLAEGSGQAKVTLSLSAERAEDHRLAIALRPKVLASLHFLLSHRAPGALSLPDARERLARDLNERLARMARGASLRVSVDELELSEAP